MIPLLVHNIDPTYFWFRNVAWLSPNLKIVIRITIIFLLALHSSNLTLCGSVMGSNVALMYLKCLKQMTNFDNGITKFRKFFAMYKQLYIITTVSNDVVYFVLPIGLFSSLLLGIVFLYVVIVLTGKISLALTFIAGSISAAIIGMVHLVLPLAAEITEASGDFKRGWEAKRELSGGDRKGLKGFRLLRLWVGPFQYVSKSSRVDFISALLYYTVSLIISVKP
ncbi:hypothetical protein Fcan01_17444 [Folsomia candida]|uniref:Uncharacterized protein n=1 Tax=Folsomia candida TaxID=158441 RepID=A0A226DTW0_FOLCA|nr:hypothetical protein Fcan01_17444 [Folsomia candida]